LSLLLLVVIQLARMGLELRKSQITTDITEMTELALIKPGVVPGMVSNSLLSLLQDCAILVIVIAVWLTTTSMSVLEPTLPVWLIENMDPPVSFDLIFNKIYILHKGGSLIFLYILEMATWTCICA
jgi:hypothetical protein